MDSNILETRLLLRESTVGSISVSRCASRMQAVCLKRPASLEAYARDLKLYEVEMNKVARCVDVCDEELEEYKAIEAAIEAQIERTEAQIKAYEAALSNEKMIRKHRELIEKLAEDVNTVPSRTALAKELHSAEDGLRGVEVSLDLVEQHIDLRRTQYADLMAAIDAIQAPIVDEAAMVESGADENKGDEDEGPEDEEREERHNPDRRRGHEGADVEAIEINDVYAGEEEGFMEGENVDAVEMDDEAIDEEFESAPADLMEGEAQAEANE